MTSAAQFEEYISNAKKALQDGSTDTASDWLNQALSLRKHLDDEAIASAYVLKAQIQITDEEYSEAEETLQNSLDLFARNLDAHLLLAELMLLDGRLEEAASALESVLSISPQDLRALSLLIFCHAQTGNRDSAKECFDRCLELDPEFPDGYYHMGICSLREGLPEAGELLHKALADNPVLSGPHYYLGTMKISQNDLAAAEKEFQKELELNPANSLAEFQLMRSYLLSVGWHEAVELFDQHFPPEAFCDIPALHTCRFHFNYDLLNQNFSPFIQALLRELPQTPQNLFHLARLYRYKSLFGDAVEILKKIIEAEKNFRPAYDELAQLYRVQDDPARACHVLEQAAALFPDAEAYCKLARAFVSSGRYTEAEEVTRRAVSLGPDLAEPHYLLGAILADTAPRRPTPHDAMREARTCLRKALELDPNYAPAKSYLMHVAFQGKDYAECIQIAEKALNDDPEDRLALSYSGRSFHATGDLPRAQEQFLRLIDLHPEDQAARAMLADVYRAQRRFTEAADELEQAITVPGRRPPSNLLFQLGEIYLLHLNEPTKARQHLIYFLQTAPPGHPDFDRAKDLLTQIKP